MGNFAGGNTIIAIAGNPHSPSRGAPDGRVSKDEGALEIAKRIWPDAKKIFYGDTLAILREHIADESVDPIYLDPPFNFDADCNVFKKVKREKTGTQSEFGL
jgi:16S rRNA G966 N2-methylase RsmD